MEDFKEIKEKSDVVGLLKLIKGIMYNTEQNFYPHWLSVKNVVGFMNMRPESGESLANFHRRWQGMVDVIDVQTGEMFMPDQIKGKLSDEENKEQYLACLFLHAVEDHHVYV